MNKTIKTISSLAFSGMLMFGATACGNKTGRKNPAGTLRIFTYTGQNYEGIDMDSVFKKIEEESGVKLAFEGASSADYYTKLAPMMNTGDFPDVIWSDPKNSSGNFDSWADPDTNNLLWNLDELLVGNEERYPYLTKLIYSPTYKNIKYFDGHYLVPNVSAPGWAIYYRADWLEQIGFVDENGKAKAPVTLAEFEYVMQKFSGNDLFVDENGTKSGQTWGISPNAEPFYVNPLYTAFGIFADWEFDANGEISYMYTNDGIKDYISWMNAMYQKGYIDPQFNTNTGSRDREDKWYTGKVGCIMTNGGEHMTWVVGQFEQNRGEGKVIVGPPPTGTGESSSITGKKLGVAGEGGFSNWGTTYGGYAITKACADPHKALDFFEYLNSPEGTKIKMYGIEGTHYELKDGKISPILSNRDREGSSFWQSTKSVENTTVLSGLHKIGSLFGGVIDWETYEETGEVLCITDFSSSYPKYADLIEKSQEYRKLKTGKLVNFTAYPASISTKMKQIQDLSSTYLLQAILGQKNLTSDWNDMISDCQKFNYSTICRIIKETAQANGIGE
ncbi:MAG: extracellular solute-binding protein [Clostridia bacterium]|nr:extracellular solute-binding protein [Clostridia bacterium]